MKDKKLLKLVRHRPDCKTKSQIYWAWKIRSHWPHVCGNLTSTVNCLLFVVFIFAISLTGTDSRHFIFARNPYLFFTAAAQIAYPNKFTAFPTKLIKYLHNLIEIYMYIGYRLGQRQHQTPVGVLELRSCGTSQRIQYYFKVNLVNFWLFLYFLCIFPIKLMFASIIIPNMTTELPLIT